LPSIEREGRHSWQQKRLAVAQTSISFWVIAFGLSSFFFLFGFPETTFFLAIALASSAELHYIDHLGIRPTCYVLIVTGDELVLVTEQLHLVFDPHVVSQVVTVPQNGGAAQLGRYWYFQMYLFPPSVIPGTCGACLWRGCPCGPGSTLEQLGCEPENKAR
jgi:hypothetical protein